MAVRSGTIGIAGGIILGLFLAYAGPSPKTPSATGAQTAGGLPPEARQREALEKDYYDFLRAEEVKALLSSKGLAARKDDTLTISYNDRPVAVFTDRRKYVCFGEGACERWSYVTTFLLRPRPDQPTESYAVVSLDPGENPAFLIVDRDGSPYWFYMNVAPSRGGRYIATGGLHGPDFQIIDWTSADHKFGYQSTNIPCEPLGWIGDESLAARCYGSDEVAFTAKVSRLPDSAWQIVESGYMGNDFKYHEKVVAHPRRYKMTPFVYSGKTSSQPAPYHAVKGIKSIAN